MTTFDHLPEPDLRQMELPLMPSVAASRAKTSRDAAGKRALMTANAPGSGVSLPGSFAHYDRDSSQWRTWQRCLTGELDVYSATWPRAGSMRNGTAYRRQPLVPTTKETGFSLWPTPRESMGDHMICWKRAESGEHRFNLEDFLASLWLRAGNVRTRGFDVNPNWIDWYGGYPVRWTDLAQSATASILPSHSGSANES